MSAYISCGCGEGKLYNNTVNISENCQITQKLSCFEEIQNFFEKNVTLSHFTVKDVLKEGILCLNTH